MRTPFAELWSSKQVSVLSEVFGDAAVWGVSMILCVTFHPGSGKQAGLECNVSFWSVLDALSGVNKCLATSLQDKSLHQILYFKSHS